MARTVGIGKQDFEKIITEDCFYIDKTHFIKEWWENKDDVTLITRPRRFGKTLTMSMLEKFFSVEYAGRGDLFERLSIWQEKSYRKLQGTYPVISLSFANVKETAYRSAAHQINQIITDLYSKNRFLLNGTLLSDREKEYYRSISSDMPEVTAAMALHQMSSFLYRYHKKKVIILLDEYDTPMQEAYVNSYWNELSAFTRNLFHASFKTNPFLERGIMTGITRISRDSIFSDLNNLKIVTTTCPEYAGCFGFTEKEVLEALEEYSLSPRMQEVKKWYDGFTFGNLTDIYNPWSIINFLDTGRLMPYWANTSSNSLIGKLIREGSRTIKMDFEKLLCGEALKTEIDEQIIYNQLNDNETAVWSLMLAAGYLKVQKQETKSADFDDWGIIYTLLLTNFEVKQMFRRIIKDWFGREESNYNDFIRALLHGDVKSMNAYMNRVALTTFSFFDGGNHPGHSEPERFYHGFVLGLIVDLSSRYLITSNRESGYGRYDVMLEPRNSDDNAIILEFKVIDPSGESSLIDTVRAALDQIGRKQYQTALIERGIAAERIRCYGFAFQGKTVLIGE